MASLESINPHAKSRITSSITEELEFSCSNFVSVAERWRKCVGDAVADDSKLHLAVKTNSKEYIMADIRVLTQPDKGASAIALEFFFDGDTKELDGQLGRKEFLDALQVTVTQGVFEYFRRKIRRSIASGSKLPTLKLAQLPDDHISSVGATLDDAFRDAGCMLSFIAVRVSLTPECAEALGGIAFPNYFGMQEDSSNDHPLPKWLVGMGATAVVMGVATIYAWTRILFYGHDLS